ncbi:hypothetical protein E4N70_10610 [Treponema vincentii]|uniref:hypothetical protein n=1 Tax=Treponema vincentii TaxID=69710 RepID=UPI0020A59DAF|nr:hypothetical protein [Treponema vincentii]UTC59844.1 hypothetical protein E4N70_10610 [Treponema vincentii]
MIKMTKRLFFCAAFLLCAVLAFAVDNSKEDISAIRVYDANDTLVCELKRDKDREAFNALLMESIAVAADNAAFTQAPKNAKIAYRYEMFDNSSTAIRLLIYADRKTAYIPNAPKDDDMPEVFAWELFGEAYKILSQPASLKKAISRYKNSSKNIFVYDAKGFLAASARIPSVEELFGEILEDYADDIKGHQFSGRFVSEKSVHEGKQLLYRYTVWDNGKSETIRIYVYSNTDTMVLSGSFPDWAECTLSKEGYELFKNPAEVLALLKDEAGL